MVRFLYPIIRQIVTLFPSRPPPPTPHGSQHWRQIHVLTYYRMGRSWIISTLLAFVTYVMPLREWVRFASHKLKCTLVLECLDIFSDTMSKDTISQKGHVFWIDLPNTQEGKENLLLMSISNVFRMPLLDCKSKHKESFTLIFISPTHLAKWLTQIFLKCRQCHRSWHLPKISVNMHFKGPEMDTKN